MRTKLEHIEGERVVAEDDSINAFYIDNTQIPDYVAAKVTDMWNKGVSIDEIDGYLQDNENVIQEDREEIIEGLYNIQNKMK